MNFNNTEHKNIENNKTEDDVYMSENGTFKTQDWKNLANGLLVVIGVLICAISGWNVQQISSLRSDLGDKMEQVSSLKIKLARLEERIDNISESENEHYEQLVKKFEKLDKKIDQLSK